MNKQFIASLMYRLMNISCIIYWYLVLDNLEFKHKNWTEFMHFQTNIYDDYLEFF